MQGRLSSKLHERFVRNGPVRNNDIEMVLLAFYEGVRQNYQFESKEGLARDFMGNNKISEALGTGN